VDDDVDDDDPDVDDVTAVVVVLARSKQSGTARSKVGAGSVSNAVSTAVMWFGPAIAHSHPNVA